MRNGVRAFFYKALGARESGHRASAAREPVQRWVRLALGLVAAAGSLLFRYALVPVLGDSEPFVPLFPLLLFATLIGGAWAGGACLIGGLIGAWYLFMGPPDSFELAPHELGGLISALLGGGVMVVLCVALRRLIAETTAAAEYERVVAREFAHRMRNTLTLVLAISRRTFTPDRPIEAARHDFEARVIALSAAHAALLDARGEDAQLQEIVTRTLAPFGYAPGDARFAIGGPAVHLAPRAATALALALHELSTNATKYGALSAPGGRVELRWRLAGLDRRDLRLSWRESGGPPVSQPERRGFGASMIESNLAQALGGTAMLDFAPEGVRAEIAARLD
jgi:two-component sensor histidine kinase